MYQVSIYIHIIVKYYLSKSLHGIWKSVQPKELDFSLIKAKVTKERTSRNLYCEEK